MPPLVGSGAVAAGFATTSRVDVVAGLVGVLAGAGVGATAAGVAGMGEPPPHAAMSTTLALETTPRRTARRRKACFRDDNSVFTSPG